MALNPYANLVVKMRHLLKVDDPLTKDQCAMFQWQLLAKVPDCDFSFIVGKGGVNTIFYLSASDKRVVCYPDEALEILQNLSKRSVFCYAAYSKDKSHLGFFLYEEDALNCESARYVRSISHKGKATLIWKKRKNLFDKIVWEPKSNSSSKDT